MKIKIPQRLDVPETSLWLEVLTQVNDVTQLGKTKSVMLLMPGGPGGNHSVYDEIKFELLKHADLILFDPRGCGYSDASDPRYCTMDHCRDDIEAIRVYFGLEKIILFGGSYGAMVSLGYAIKYEGRLERLILNAGAPSFRFIDLAKENLKKLGNSEQILAGERLFSGLLKSPQEFEEFSQLMAPLYIYKHQQQDVAPTTKTKIPYNIDITNLGFSSFLANFDYEPYLEGIDCETLIICGKNDWINDPSLAELMARKIPNSKLVLLDECGHFIWRDQKENFFKAIQDFFKRENKFSLSLCEEKQFTCKL